MHKWHDATGVSILLFCFLGTWLLSEKFNSQKKKDVPALSNSPAVVKNNLSIRPALALSLALGLLVSEISVRSWYRFHEGASSQQQWTIQVPDRKQVKKFEIDKAVTSRLLCDEGHAFGWLESDFTKWQMLYFVWQPAWTQLQRIAVQDGKNHGPEHCLSAIGKTLKSNDGVKMIEFSQGKLPFQRYVFDDDGEKLHVFFCLWQDRLASWSEADYEKYYLKSPRLISILRGNRSAGEGLQILELAVWGIDNGKDAEAALIHQLNELVKVQSDSKLKADNGSSH